MLLMVVAEISDFKDKSVMELVSKSINFCPLFTEKFGTHHVYYPIFEKRRIEGKSENLCINPQLLNFILSASK